MKVTRHFTRIALNRTEVALAIGVSANTVDVMVKEGALPPPRRWHSRKLWLVSEIEAAMSEWPVNGEDEALQSWEMEVGPSVPIMETSASTKGREEIADINRKLSGKAQHALYLEIGHAKYEELMQARHREWAANLPNEPLDKRERIALDQLARHGVGVPVSFRNVKQLGPGTEERLKLRGFIDNNFQKKFPDRVYEYWITAAGMEAWEKLVGDA